LGFLLSLLSAFFFGAGSTAVAHANIHGDIDKNEGLIITLIINNLLNLLLLPFVFIFTQVPALNWMGILSFAGGGFFTSFLGRLLLFSSIGMIGASRAGSIKITAPVFTVLLGVWVLRENLTLLNIVGIAVVLAGVMMVSLETQKIQQEESGSTDSTFITKENNAGPAGSAGKINLGIPLGFLAGFSLGTGNVLRKVGIMYYGNPLIGATISSLVSLFCTLLVFKMRKIKVHFSMKSLFLKKGSRGYIAFGILTSLAIYSLFFSLLYLPVSIVNTMTSVESLFTFFTAWLLLKRKESVTGFLFLGTIIVISGVVLIVWN
jgi:drug/metabolite transporter (DMT)-like permease